MIPYKVMIPLSRPDITEKEIQAVIDVLKAPHLSLGPKLTEFEKKFAEYIGTKYAIAVNSGTSGLHLAIKSLGIGENDGVITTPFSFIASANCILYENALPTFVDIEPRTFNIDPEKINEFIEKNCERCQKTGRPIHKTTGRVIKALLPVHVFGHPCQMDKLIEIADTYNLYIIEDACEALGAKIRKKKVGTFGDCAVFAFYPNKQMTTGEGGMVVTNNENIAFLCRSYRNQGRDSDGGWLAHSRIGYNYRLNEISCALGIAQLERIDEILKKREEAAFEYNRLLKGIVRIPENTQNIKRSWFVYVVSLLDEYPSGLRDRVISLLLDKGIACNNYFPPIHLQPFYKSQFNLQNGDFEITELVAQRTIALPFYNNLKKEQISFVAESLSNILKNISYPYQNSY